MPRGRPRKNPSSRDNVLLRSAEFIGWALGGLEREIVQTRERLAMLNAEAARLRTRIGAGRTAPATGPAAAATFDEPAVSNRKRRRRRMSDEARKRISEMMKKRWAERKKNQR
jgi:hypothetical protein